MSIVRILEALDEREMARSVLSDHDEARLSFSLRCNTVNSFDEFTRMIGDYYNHHFSRCFRGRLPQHEAEERAKQILERAYRNQGGDIAMAYNDAHDGTEGGLRAVLDHVADGIKAEATEHYVNSIFDRFVSPVSWCEKVEVIRQFIARCGVDLSRSLHTGEPERYARDYKDLVRAYVDGLKRTARVFRRL